MFKSLVSVNQVAGLPIQSSFREFYNSLPPILAGNGLRDLARAIVEAKRAVAPVVFAIGGHVIKVGAGPLLVDLAARGFVTHVAMNGAAAIHDFELGMFGETSQDVQATMLAGEFGRRETADAFAAAAKRQDIRLSKALGSVVRRDGPYSQISVLASADTTIHLSIGADTIWNYLSDSEAGRLGSRGWLEYDQLRLVVLDMDRRPGVWVNIGSAQLLPEVFLKACSWAISEGADLSQITKANMDFAPSYRTTENVLRRGPGRQSIELIGHHEINLPLLRSAILVESGKQA